MTLRREESKGLLQEKKDKAVRQTNKPLESTFLNSNNSSRSNYESLTKKVIKVVERMESNIHKLKEVCDMPDTCRPLSSSRDKNSKSKSKTGQVREQGEKITSIQKLYAVAHGRPTNNLFKLHNFYEQYLSKQTSSSSQRQVPACRTNKRKTIQEIKVVQTSPFKNGSLSSRRSAESTKNIRAPSSSNVLTIDDFRKGPLVKTQMSSRQLKKQHLLKIQRLDSEAKYDSKQLSGTKNNPKSILKKPSYNVKPQGKAVRPSVPSVILTDQSVRTKGAFSMLKSMQNSPSHFELLSRQKPKLISPETKSITRQTPRCPIPKSKQTMKRQSTNKSKSKESADFREPKRKPPKLNSRLHVFLKDIDQMSPISNTSLRHRPP